MGHRGHQTILLYNINGSIQCMINSSCSSNGKCNELVLVIVIGYKCIKFLFVLVMVTSSYRYQQAVESLGHLVPLRRHPLSQDSMIWDVCQTTISNVDHRVS